MLVLPLFESNAMTNIFHNYLLTTFKLIEFLIGTYHFFLLRSIIDATFIMHQLHQIMLVIV